LKNQAFSRLIATGFVALVAGSACAGSDVTVTIDSRAVSAGVVWYDVAVIEATDCAHALPNMVAGIPQDAGSLWTGFGVGVSKSVPPLGDIKKGKYTFAVSAKDANCGTIGLGCTDMEVSGGEEVTVVIKPTENPGIGACDATAQCVAANCIPRPTTGTGSVRSLVLERTGEGDFGDPFGGVGTVIGTPALIARGNQFLLAYREQGAAGTRLTTRTLGADGLAAAPVARLLDGRCALSEADATAVAAGGGAVVVGLSHPPCPNNASKGGIDLVEVGVDAVPTRVSFTGNTGVSSTFSSASGLAYDPNAKAFVAAFQAAGAPTVATVDARLVLGNGVRVGDGTGSANAVASSPAMALLVTADSRGLAVRAGKSVDAAAQGLVIARLSGRLGAVWIDGRSAYVASTVASESGDDIALARFDVAADFLSAKRTDHTTATPEGSGAITGLALTGRSDRLFLAATRKGAVDLFVYRRTPIGFDFEAHRPLTDGAFLSTPGQVRDGGVAIAANDSAVSVAWTRATTTTAGDTPGGWSVFAAPLVNP
jgi:hypothetical protein